jgi:hypothetical protein
MMKHALLSTLAACALLLSGCLGRGQSAASATPPPLFTATTAAEPATATVAATVAPATAAPSAAPSETAAPTTTATGTAASASATAPANASTATPAAPATPDPNEAVGDSVYQDKLDGTGGWFWTFADDVATFGVVDAKLKGVMKTANSGWRFTISPDTLQLGSQQVSLNSQTVSCGPNDEYGLMLRVKPDANDTLFQGYLFSLRCSGQASFEVISGTNRSTLVDWTGSPAIKTGAPAANTLLVWAAGSEFRCYVNGQYLFTATDASLKAGFYGIYLYDRTAGGETVTFDTLAAKAVAK